MKDKVHTIFKLNILLACFQAPRVSTLTKNGRSRRVH